MQPMLSKAVSLVIMGGKTYLNAKLILMDRFATKATDVPPKVINLILTTNAPAQATNPMPL